MSRHRNIRNISYEDEDYQYEDIYGHSVDDDYGTSPSVEQFIYDRSSQQVLSGFIQTNEQIKEEEEEFTRGTAMEVDLDDLLKLIDSVTINPHSPSIEVVELDIDDLISGACTELPSAVRSSPETSENLGTSKLHRDTFPSKLNISEELSVKSNVADIKVQNTTPAVPVAERLDDSNTSSNVKLVDQQDKINPEKTTFLSPQIALKSEDTKGKKSLSCDTDESDSDLEDYSWMDLVELTGFKLKSATSTTEEVYEEISETLNHQRCYKPTIVLKDCFDAGIIIKPVLYDRKVEEKCYEKIKTPIKPFDFSIPSPDACVRQRRLGTNIV